MRELFQRIENKDIVNIEVDLNAFAFSNVCPWLLSVFIKFEANEDNYEEFLELKESLIISLEYEELSKYVGSRVIDGWYELYFYAKDSKLLSIKVSKILANSGHVYETSVVRDAKWDFHYKNIVPTELELCHIESEKIIFLLEEEGDNLKIEREVEHYISFELPTQKNRFLNTLDLEGFSVKDELSTEDFEYGVALVKKHNVTSAQVKEIVQTLYTEIKKAQGYYEGWSTTLMNDENV